MYKCETCLFDELIEKYGRFEENYAKRIFRNLCLAISHMHSKGQCHRDIKLDNILFDSKRNEIKLSDFTVSRGGIKP